MREPQVYASELPRLPAMELDTDLSTGMAWGWLIAMIGIQSVAMSMAELCSSMPTSGKIKHNPLKACTVLIAVQVDCITHLQSSHLQDGAH